MGTVTDYPQASELQTSRWFNSSPLTLASLRGRIVAIHAFQMLCPGCVSDGLPQATRISKMFARSEVAVIGLHSVFEHHQAMTDVALDAFVHEYRLGFPIAVDRASTSGPIPLTMQAYGLRGTPSLLIIDQAGRIRLHHFGHIDDMAVGALLGRLIAEGGARSSAKDEAARTEPIAAAACDERACAPR